VFGIAFFQPKADETSDESKIERSLVQMSSENKAAERLLSQA